MEEIPGENRLRTRGGGGKLGIPSCQKQYSAVPYERRYYIFISGDLSWRLRLERETHFGGTVVRFLGY